MHRTVFLAALVIGTLLSGLSGCSPGEGPFPSSEYDHADGGNFVVDGVTPIHTFALDVVLDGSWTVGSPDGQGLGAGPTLAVQVEVEPLIDEGIAPVTTEVSLDGEVIAAHTLDPAADEAITNLDVRSAFDGCAIGTRCEVHLVVDVLREGESGAMFANVSASVAAIGAAGEPLVATVDLASTP